MKTDFINEVRISTICVLSLVAEPKRGARYRTFNVTDHTKSSIKPLAFKNFM